MNRILVTAIAAVLAGTAGYATDVRADIIDDRNRITTACSEHESEEDERSDHPTIITEAARLSPLPHPSLRNRNSVRSSSGRIVGAERFSE